MSSTEAAAAGSAVRTETAVVDDLTILTPQHEPLLRKASLHLASGTVVGLTGPSGAGKTTLLRILLGYVPPGTACVEGSVRVCGEDVLALRGQHLQRFRNSHLAFVGQDPGACLNPTMKVRTLLREANRNKGADVDRALELVQLSPKFLRRRPGELSGGQQRRVALARALVRGVDVLLIDEPLAGLQGPLRKEIIGVLRAVAHDAQVAIAVTGHQVELERDLADALVRVVACGESGHTCSTSQATPRRRQAGGTLVPSRSSSATDPGLRTDLRKFGDPILAGENVEAWSGKHRILHGVDFAVPRGGVTAMMGASGAGKTTLARVLVGLHAEASGKLMIDTTPIPFPALRRDNRHRSRIQYVPQNPLSTLNPRKTVRATVERPMKRRGVPSGELRERVTALLEQMGLSDDFGDRYPKELSGGQRQRVAIARALAASPEVLVCDEITSALDAKTAESIMRTLTQAVKDTSLSVVLISHEVDEIREYSDFVHVVAEGRVAESGPTREVFTAPQSQQARDLLA